MAVDLPNTSGGSTNYIRWAASPVSAFPFSMHIRANPDTLADASDSGGMFGLFNSASANDRIVLYAGLGGDAQLTLFHNVDASETVQTTTTMSAGTWHSCCGVWAASNDKAVYLDNGGEATGSATNNLPSADRVTCGRWDDLSPNLGYDGKLADAAIWSVALTSAERQALADGASPLLIRPGALLFYAPLWEAGLTADMIGGIVPTEAGTINDEAHPPVAHAASVVYANFTPAAAGGTHPVGPFSHPLGGAFAGALG